MFDPPAQNAAMTEKHALIVEIPVQGQTIEPMSEA